MNISIERDRNISDRIFFILLNFTSDCFDSAAERRVQVLRYSVAETFSSPRRTGFEKLTRSLYCFVGGGEVNVSPYQLGIRDAELFSSLPRTGLLV